jgi:hypothetical protein
VRGLVAIISCLSEQEGLLAAKSVSRVAAEKISSRANALRIVDLLRETLVDATPPPVLLKG